MNITDNLIRIKEGKENIIQSLKNKGVSIADNTLINEIPTIIDNAEIGGGGDTPSQPDVPELVQKYEGASVFRINVPTDNYEFAINLSNNTAATYDVDWGDGSLEYGLTTDEQHHTYTKKGIYDINIYNLSKDITLGGYYTLKGGVKTFIIYYLFNNSNNYYWDGGIYLENKDNTICTDIILGNRITKIGQEAFYNQYYLRTIQLSNITNIGSSAFYNCYSLQSIVIPNGISSLSPSIFSNCYSLKSVVVPENFKIFYESVFSGCKSLEHINFPNSLQQIGNYAFSSCSSLRNIIIPNKIVNISNYAFQNCTALKSVVIPEGVTFIGSDTFYNCSALQSLVIPEGITTLYNSFSKCYSLNYIDLPSTLTSIQSGNFDSNSSSENIKLHYIISRALIAPTIYSSTFKYSPNNGVLYIPKDADITTYQSSYWKTNLLDNGWQIQYIEDMPEKVPTTFEFTTVNDIPIKISSMGKGNLISEEKEGNKNIYKFDDIIYIPYNYYPDIFKTIKIVGGVELEDSCFSMKSILENIELPESLEKIPKNCFMNSKIQSITIPSTTIEIENSCFYGCQYLHTITVKAEVAPTILNEVFDYVGTQVSGEKILRVPEGSDYSSWKSKLSGFTIEYIPLSELQ